MKKDYLRDRIKDLKSKTKKATGKLIGYLGSDKNNNFGKKFSSNHSHYDNRKYGQKNDW